MRIYSFLLYIYSEYREGQVEPSDIFYLTAHKWAEVFNKQSHAIAVLNSRNARNALHLLALVLGAQYQLSLPRRSPYLFTLPVSGRSTRTIEETAHYLAGQSPASG